MNGLIGQRLGQYHVLQEVGRGGMAIVYKARDLALDRYVAIKILAPHLSGHPTFVERFLREARTAARLRHPSIVQIYDVGQHGQIQYFVMEFLDGETLGVLRRRRGVLSPAKVLGILSQVGSALDYAHSQGVVHRDVKPANIMVCSDRAVLTDFGIVRAVGEARLTATHMRLGTPEYMSPEQAAGESVGPASDRYALAIVAYEMLAGQVPLLADNPAALMYRLIHETPPPLRQWRPDLPAQVDAVFGYALAKNPQERYASALAFCQVLGQALTIAGDAPGDIHLSSHIPPGKTTRIKAGIAITTVVVMGMILVLLFRNSFFPSANNPSDRIEPTVRVPAPTVTTGGSELLRSPLPTKSLPTSPAATPSSPSPTRVSPTSRPESPTPSLEAELESALWNYVAVREQAEETLSPDLLDQVCINPYLSEKKARIEQNRREGSRWETWSVYFTITSVESLGTNKAQVVVRKQETKLFYPPGSSIPDDEICSGSMRSYRDCLYEARYIMIRRYGIWYVSEATFTDINCPITCQR